MMTTSLLTFVFAGLMLLVSGPASADSWALPTVRTYASQNQAWRFVVHPRDLRSQLAFFEDKVSGREPAGQDHAGQSECRGRLERRLDGGGWVLVWERRLQNEVAPVSAVVSNSGDFVATFDNWHSMGEGPTTVVIYGAGGRLVRALALADFLSPQHIGALPRTASSTHWGHVHMFTSDSRELVLNALRPGEQPFSPSPRLVQVRIRSSDGTVLTPRQ